MQKCPADGNAFEPPSDKHITSGQDVMLAKALLLVAAAVALLLLLQPGADLSSPGHDVCHDVGISLLQGRRANVRHSPSPPLDPALAHPDPHDPC